MSDANIWLLAPNVVQSSFRSPSLIVMRYAGMIDIKVAIYLFLNIPILDAEPNSTIMYLCIRVAESNVVAANDTTNTTINVIAIDSENPICCSKPALPSINTERAPDFALLKLHAHGKHIFEFPFTN